MGVVHDFMTALEDDVLRLCVHYHQPGRFPGGDVPDVFTTPAFYRALSADMATMARVTTGGFASSHMTQLQIQTSAGTSTIYVLPPAIASLLNGPWRPVSSRKLVGVGTPGCDLNIGELLYGDVGTPVKCYAHNSAVGHDLILGRYSRPNITVQCIHNSFVSRDIGYVLDYSAFGDRIQAHQAPQAQSVSKLAEALATKRNKARWKL